MIANSQDGEPGGRGEEPYLWPAEQNKLVRMMLNPRRRWKLTKQAKEAAMMAMLNNLSDDDARVRNGAVANLIRMEGQNQKDHHKAIDKKLPDLHEHGGTVEHRHGLSNLMSEPDYVGYLRNRTSNQDCDAGLVCQIREPGNGKALENGTSHGGPGPGANGHRNGSE